MVTRGSLGDRVASYASVAATCALLSTLRPGPILRRSHKVAPHVRIEFHASCFRPQSPRPMTVFQRVSSLIVLAMVWLSPAAPARAQDYPSRPVKMIVPFGAGGPTDIFTRALAEELRKALKEPFVMENRPGAGTIIGSEAAAKSPPDGYTLLMISETQTTTETLVPNKSYKPAYAHSSKSASWPQTQDQI